MASALPLPHLLWPLSHARAGREDVTTSKKLLQPNSTLPLTQGLQGFVQQRFTMLLYCTEKSLGKATYGTTCDAKLLFLEEQTAPSPAVCWATDVGAGTYGGRQTPAQHGS